MNSNSADNDVDGSEANDNGPAITQTVHESDSLPVSDFAALKQGVKVVGLVGGDTAATVITTIPMSCDDPSSPAGATVIYQVGSERPDQRVISKEDLKNLRIVTSSSELPPLDGDPVRFRLASEGLRIKYAAAYDPMSAVYSSAILPLPHQLEAVYEDMLPQKPPMRFLLADDPGAGKTIMAGLYIKEMLLRGVADRVAIICPGGLAEQWQNELSTKFDLHFEIFGRAMAEDWTNSSGNPFAAHNYLIMRMDQIARNKEYVQMLQDVHWDIAVVDEAHRMSAHYKNKRTEELNKTGRFMLGETIADTSENLLLMTATPHNGNEDDFRLFLSLLDKDRFGGRYHGRHAKNGRLDLLGVMRRVVKENLKDFNGKPLFPPRVAHTVAYELSPAEKNLYEHVTDYVRSGMVQAKQLEQQGHENKRRGSNIGFALTILQRRLASSPNAIYKSLIRRQERLESLLKEIRSGRPARAVLDEAQSKTPSFDGDYDDIWDDTPEDEQGTIEDQVNEIVDSSTAAQSADELSDEINRLAGLVAEAHAVRASGTDTKWTELRKVLDTNVLNAGGEKHKLIVFTEHRDTLDYIVDKIRRYANSPEFVITIHGGMSRDERHKAENQFLNDPRTRILVATDAAGEGLNLQRANLMVNYDLPWNPNRIEQRFGRIHRIGQKLPCYLWNLVAHGTREGDVYLRLLRKIDTMSQDYQGQIFNVLGDPKIFNGVPLRDLMLEAIERGGSKSEAQEIDKKVDAVFEAGRKRLDLDVRKRAMNPDIFPSINVERLRERMERYRLRKLQPGYVEEFFVSAFRSIGGSIYRRESGRWEITHIPHAMKQDAISRDRRSPLADRYERVTFLQNRIHVDDSDSPDALLIAPGSMLLATLIDVIEERYGRDLERGTVFVDRTDSQPDEPFLLMYDKSSLDDGNGHRVFQGFTYLQMSTNGDFSVLRAPALSDYEAPRESEKTAVRTVMHQPWLSRHYISRARSYAYSNLTKPESEDLQKRINQDADHQMSQVQQRLQEEIDYWIESYNHAVDARNMARTRGDAKAARSASKHVAYASNEVTQYKERKESRVEEIIKSKLLAPQPDEIGGVALVIPSKQLQPQGGVPARARLFARETKEVDERAIQKTMEAERTLGRHPHEEAHNNKGWDITSFDPKTGTSIYIEVKGRIQAPNVRTFTVSRSEAVFGRTQGDHHRLSIVLVSPKGPQHDQIRYVRHAFDSLTPSSATVSSNESLKNYWERGERPY